MHNIWYISPLLSRQGGRGQLKQCLLFVYFICILYFFVFNLCNRHQHHHYILWILLTSCPHVLAVVLALTISHITVIYILPGAASEKLTHSPMECMAWCTISQLNMFIYVYIAAPRIQNHTRANGQMHYTYSTLNPWTRKCTARSLSGA